MTDENLSPVLSDQSLTQYRERAPELLQSVRALTILTDDDYTLCCEYKLAAGDGRKAINGIVARIKAAAKMALEVSVQPWERLVAPFVEAEALAERKRKEYRDAQEARQKADAAEREASARHREDERRLRDAIALEAAKAPAAVVDSVLNAPARTAPLVTGRAVPKVAGIRDAKTPKLEIDDVDAFLRALGAALLLRAEANTPGGGDPTIKAYLAQAATASIDWHIIVPHIDVKTGWLRTQYTQQREAFKVPGVKAWHE